MSAPSILRYRFPEGGRVLAAHLNTPELQPLLESFYRGYRCTEVGSGAATECVISLEREDGTYRLIGPSGDWQADTPGEAVLYYESELTGALLEDAAAYVRLHGAAVCAGSRCLLLVGPSGAGKSTLSLGFCLSGRRALADDVVLIDPEVGDVHAFERSIRVHEASLKILGAEPSEVCGARLCEPYLWLDPQLPESGREPPAAVVFLENGEATVLERLGAAETLRRLLLARFADAGGGERDFECLARLAARAPGYRLAFGSLKEALSELEALFSAL